MTLDKLLRARLDMIINSAHALFIRDHRIDPIAFIMSRKEMKIIGLKQAIKHSDLVADALRDECARMRPDSIVIISESWTVDVPAAQVAAATKQTLQLHPEKREDVALFIETLYGNWLGRAPIVRTPDGATMGDFTFVKGLPVGRFTHLLGPHRHQ
jgi:hypothetical protein